MLCCFTFCHNSKYVVLVFCYSKCEENKCVVIVPLKEQNQKIQFKMMLYLKSSQRMSQDYLKLGLFMSCYTIWEEDQSLSLLLRSLILVSSYCKILMSWVTLLKSYKEEIIVLFTGEFLEFLVCFLLLLKFIF